MNDMKEVGLLLEMEILPQELLDYYCSLFELVYLSDFEH